jgi:very-short-patch-repair endonuclease
MDIITDCDVRLCDYGCGNVAKYKYVGGTWSCSEKFPQCPENRRKNSERNKGKKKSEEHCKNISLSKMGDKNPTKRPEVKEKMKSEMKKLWSDKDSIFNTKEYRQKLKNRPAVWNKGLKNCFSEESCLKISVGNKGKHKNTEEFKQELRENCLNGHAAKMNKYIKNASPLEIKLREIILELYPCADPQHQVLNYSIDIAIPEYKIAIEHDGKYHFNTKKQKEDLIRQTKIENEGWKFIRYSVKKSFPTKEQIIEDINKLIIERNSND